MIANQLEKVFIAGEVLTKDQIAFQKRVASLKQLKNDLKILEADIKAAKAELSKHILPLELKHISLMKQRLFVLEEAYLRKRLSKGLNNTLKEIILEECESLLAIDHEDQKILEIYNRFNDDAGDFTLEENEKIYEEFHKFFFNEQTSEEGEEPVKSKQQAKKEERLKAKEEAKKRSFKDIYRDLVKIFHPDKEKDEGKKKEKEELTKEITKAYKNNDLLALLEMELTLLKTSRDRIKQLASDKLKLYNEILLSQKQDLEAQIYRLKSENEFVYRTMCYKNSDKRRTIATIKKQWEVKIEDLKKVNENLRDNSYLKFFVKSYDYLMNVY